MRPIIFYARCMLAFFWFLAASFAAMAFLPFRWKDPSMGAVFARILYRGVPYIFGFRTRVENQHHLYVNQPCIYVVNHQSNLDIFTMAALFPYRTVVIGKKELKWLPLFGLFFIGSGNIVIDRSNRTHALAGLDAAAKHIKESGASVWIFPEGTRNRGAAEMLPFKKGAFHLAIKAQVPIVPIVHQHLFSYARMHDYKFVPGEVLVRVLEPVPTEGMTGEDVGRLMGEVRSRMQAALADRALKPQNVRIEPSAARS